MEIGPVSSNTPVPPDGPGRGKPQPQEAGPLGIVDKIEISEDARAKLADLADRERLLESASGETEASREDRLTQIRERIRSGYYDQPGVDDAVADRLIDDLDL